MFNPKIRSAVLVIISSRGLPVIVVSAVFYTLEGILCPRTRRKRYYAIYVTYSSFRSIAYRLYFIGFIFVPRIVSPSLIYVFRVQISLRGDDTFERDCRHTAAGVRTDNTLQQFTTQIQFANDVGPHPPLIRHESVDIMGGKMFVVATNNTLTSNTYPLARPANWRAEHSGACSPSTPPESEVGETSCRWVSDKNR